MNHLEKPEFNWQILVKTINKPTINVNTTEKSDINSENVHYIYICKKLAD